MIQDDRDDGELLGLIANRDRDALEALFTVDSAGYGQVIGVPVNPVTWFDAIGITIEPAWGSDGPTGTNVLKGDL